ncbi:DUF2306 domain-containing protein [Qipengyuania sp. SS22]|uniref:DUF2306 domain-containing protein n=1 Tax=Qipengyuania sp. SS22 TaxID=2979461 RepID=UPI0021E5BF80|nr:DUF2306 domain-containing protein [Qipengyuania sp. SS22]UYH54322.1 DUF2306 domain-containing protein [Qipengyuania sp. SS22]
MFALALPAPFTARKPSTFDIGPVSRALVTIVGTVMTLLCVIAIGRALGGLTPELPRLRNLAIAIHVVSVLPAIPLGAYVLLTRKGDARHKQLGKIWLALMLLTAFSAIFIKTSGSFGPIHVFVPLTIFSAWRSVATARRGDIARHKRQLVFTYLTGLVFPGLAAFLLPGRLMNVILFG